MAQPVVGNAPGTCTHIRSSLLARRGRNYIQMIEFFCLWTTLDTPQAGGNRLIRSSSSFDSIRICFFFFFQIVYLFWWAVTVRLAKCGRRRIYSQRSPSVWLPFVAMKLRKKRIFLSNWAVAHRMRLDASPYPAKQTKLSNRWIENEFTPSVSRLPPLAIRVTKQLAARIFHHNWAQRVEPEINLHIKFHYGGNETNKETASGKNWIARTMDRRRLRGRRSPLPFTTRTWPVGRMPISLERCIARPALSLHSVHKNTRHFDGAERPAKEEEEEKIRSRTQEATKSRK